MPELTISYDVFEDVNDLPGIEQQLLAEATQALDYSYAPYSGFHVGAAALLADGSVARGWNTENAAYPMCLCAEPACLAAAASLRPGMPVLVMAITVRNPKKAVRQPASPCGPCRQQLLEHEQRFGVALRLILRGEAGPAWVFGSAGSLLPFGFGGEVL